MDAVATGLMNAFGGRSEADPEAVRDLVQRGYTWSSIAREYVDFFWELMDQTGE